MSDTTEVLVGCVVLLVDISALYALLCHEHQIAGWLYRRLGPRRWLHVIGDPCAKALAEAEDVWYPTDVAEEDARRDPYPPEAADAPDGVDERFGSIYVESDHPRDCGAACCREIRLNELTDAFDWHAYEYEMRKTK